MDSITRLNTSARIEPVLIPSKQTSVTPIKIGEHLREPNTKSKVVFLFSFDDVLIFLTLLYLFLAHNFLITNNLHDQL